MSLFKKSNRKFRQRTFRDDSDEESAKEKQTTELLQTNNVKENQEVIDLESNENKESKTKEIEFKKKPSFKISNEKTGAIKLSFDEEEEGEEEEFQVKQSNYSIRLAKQIEREKRRKEKEENKPKDKNKLIGSSVSIRKLMERKKQQIHAELQDQSESNANQTIEPNEESNVDCLETKSMDTNSDNECVEVNCNLDVPITIEDDEENLEEDWKDDLSKSMFSIKSIQKGAIPDHKTIDELKKQRKMARDSDDLTFIPLSQRKTINFDKIEKAKLDKNSMLTTQHLKSRLIREDPNDIENCDGDDVDVDEERVDFCIDKSAVEKEKFKEAFFLAQEEDEDLNRDDSANDSDRELERWEREQIRKGVGIQSAQTDINLNLTSSETSNKQKAKKKSNNTPIPKYLLNCKPAPSKQQVLDDCNEKIEKLKNNLESARTQLKHIDITMDSLQESIEQKRSYLSCID